jgi:uncharacterized repeat protein (TIGR01451 family)
VTPIGHVEAARAALALVKRALHPVVKAGQVASFSLKVTDTSSVPATGVIVCDALPVQTQYVGASRPADFHGATACFKVGTLAAHASATIVIRLSIDQGTRGIVVNHATATSTDAGAAHAQAQVRVPASALRRVTAPVTG